MTVEQIQIATRDGSCRSFVFRPDGKGTWPGVLMLMDGIGIRPAMLEVGERLARQGYFVLLPDLFYRSGPYEPMNGMTVFSDPAQRKVLMEKYFALATPANVMSDIPAFLDYLAAQPDVRPGPVSLTGYCMGGRLALIAAATYPGRFAAVGSYHPSQLATDAPDSPHRLIARITARVYIARAIEDAGFDDAMLQRVEAALSSAGVDHLIETYPARHGFVFRDTPSWDQAAAERHWKTLIPLLGGAPERAA